MGERAHALMTGAFVLVLSAAVVVFAVWLLGSREARDPYLVVSESEITGLTEASTVYFRGVAAGSVQKIRFGPPGSGEILIRIGVDPDMPVTEGTYASLRPQGITGLAQLVLHDDGSNPDPLPTGAEDPARIPLEPGLVQQVTDAGSEIVGNVETLSQSLNALLNNENRQHVSEILSNLAAASSGLEQLEQQIAESLEGVPALTERAEETLTAYRDLARELEGLPAELQSLTEDLGRLTASGETIGRRVEQEIVPALARGLRQLEDSAREVERTARTLRKQPGSLLWGRDTARPGPGEPGYEED